MQDLTDINLSSNATRIILEIRRILKKDHQKEIVLHKNKAIIMLIEAVKESKDRLLDNLVINLCDEFLDCGVDPKEIQDYFQYLGVAPSKKFLSFAQEIKLKITSEHIKKTVYRGKEIIKTEETLLEENPIESKETEHNKVIIYRGQKILKKAD